MSSVRRPLTAAEHAALAATPLPFAVIWSEENFDAFLSAAERGATMTYLHYLREYRNTLASNNPVYNNLEKTAKQQELLRELPEFIQTLDQAAEPDLCAAAMNIHGLLLRDTRDYQAARQVLDAALRLNKLADFSLASIYHSLALVATAEKNLEVKFDCQSTAVTFANRMTLGHTVDRHIVAAIYSAMGNILHEKAEMEEALRYHMTAVDLWPGNNVIANNAAIFFSKQNEELALLKAEQILEKFYDKMMDASSGPEDYLFVTPFYRADVNIKLAGFAKSNDTGQMNEYLRRGEVYSNIAATALAKNPGYQLNYRNKGLARIGYLAANAAYVRQDHRAIDDKQLEASLLRSQVEEPTAKYEKFMAKFPRHAPFKTAGMFRDRSKSVTTETDQKPEMNRLQI